MTDCKKHGFFGPNERHECFVIGCSSSFHPLNSPTCPICNFKKCDNGHCGCSLSQEAKYVADTLYKTYCDVCMGEEYNWDFVRMPAIGKKGITILEAKLDSMKTMFSLSKVNYEKIQLRLHDCLRIVRNAIEEDKKATCDSMKIKRCTFRETKKTRCNKSPARPIERAGKTIYRCKYHENPLLMSIQPEIQNNVS